MGKRMPLERLGPVVEVGKDDVLERVYMGKFRELAARHGEFVTYERDRAARDIGLHFTRAHPSGHESVSIALRWFQHKGIAQSTLDATAIEASDAVRLSLKVKHLKFWYMLPDPTYLVVYLEAKDQFLIIDIQQHVERVWGQGILTLQQKNATVEVPTSSVLDDSAFQQILDRSDAEWLQRFCSASPEQARLVLRDCDLIVAVDAAERRGSKIELRFRDWITKLRSELTLTEIDPSQNESVLQLRWVYMLEIGDIENHLPWLECCQVGRHIDDWVDDDVAEDEEYEPFDEEDHVVREPPSGHRLYGHEKAGEVVDYRMYVRLNGTGRAMLEWVMKMSEAGQLVVKASAGEVVSVDPWNKRSV
jgi:hypothetical protein